LPIIMSDSKLIATVMRSVIADALTKPLDQLNEKMGAVVSGLATLQGRMTDLETRQTALETRWSDPNKVAWVALFLALVELGALVVMVVR
jgi:hypothetical protein